ncbi:MAG: hypothetical protein JW754_01985 [Candidatus Aenigmarchaeota archaeon]|nr:hypothetical protein [Candidatus Aenigmarchaeota archaeon]
MTTTKKAVGFAKLIPYGLLVGMQVIAILLDMKLKIWRSRGHFEKGLVEAGVGKGEAKIIMKGCYDGEDG